MILILLVLLLSGYIFYDKILNSKDSLEMEVKEENTTVKEENSENLNAVADILVNKLDKYYVDYYDSLGSVDFSNVSDKNKMEAALLYGGSFEITKNIVEDYYKNLFGVTLTEYPDLTCWALDGVYAKYNASKGEYEIQGNHSHGGIEGHPKSGIIKQNNIERDGDNYVITVTKVFYPSVKNSDGYFYADYNYTTKISGLNNYGGHELSDAEKTNVKEYYDQNYETFKNIKPQYKYTFTKTNEDYHLISYEIIN